MTDKRARVWNGTEWIDISSPIGVPNSIAVFQSEPPSTPGDGQIWVNSDTTVALEWPPIGAPVSLSTTAPISPNLNDLWVDNSSSPVLKIYDGSAWVSVGGSGGSVAGDSSDLIIANRMFG
jgi:hypothetical protein